MILAAPREVNSFQHADSSAGWLLFRHATSTRFPEGTVLNLRFRLALTGAEIRARCEVRYCLPGIGVGVEFVDIAPEAVRKIEREVQLCKRPRLRRKTVKVR